MADFFRTLAEPARLQILNLLRTAEHNVGELAELTGYSIANVSRHLSQLQRQGFVLRESRGNNAYYRIADPAIYQLCDMVCGQIAKRFDAQAAQGAAFTALRTAAKTPRRTKASCMKLPPLLDKGTTIFTVMSALAAEHGAINLGQGFPTLAPTSARCACWARAAWPATTNTCR